MRIHIIIKSAILISFALFINQFICFASEKVFKAGTSKVNITPPVGIYWAFKGQLLEGVADELYAKVLVLNDGLNTIAIVSTDLLWMPLEYTNQIRKIVKDKNGIPEE